MWEPVLKTLRKFLSSCYRIKWNLALCCLMADAELCCQVVGDPYNPKPAVSIPENFLYWGELFHSHLQAALPKAQGVVPEELPCTTRGQFAQCYSVGLNYSNHTLDLPFFFPPRCKRNYFWKIYTAESGSLDRRAVSAKLWGRLNIRLTFVEFTELVEAKCLHEELHLWLWQEGTVPSGPQSDLFPSF